MLPSSIIRSALAVSAVVFLVAVASGELAQDPAIDLFGDGLLRPVAAPQAAGLDDPDAATAKSELRPHTMVFRGGGELRGKLLSIEGAVVTWQIPETSSPIRFPASDLREIVLGEVEPFVSDDTAPSEDAINDIDPGELPAKPVPPLHATLKLAGADWLFGDVNSRDGKHFVLELHEHVSIELDRPGVRWIAFGCNPAPALDFSAAEPAGLASWKDGHVVATAAANGTLRFAEGHWITAMLRGPKRFQVSLEVPKDKEDGSNITIQPPGLDAPNCFTTGSMSFQLGTHQLRHNIFANGFNQGTTRVVGEDSEGAGASTYKLFYDGISERIVIVRNGRKEEDLSFREGLKDDASTGAIPAPAEIIIHPSGADSTLALNYLRVEPWSGVVPRENEVPIRRESLQRDSQSAVEGALGSIGPKSLRFDGIEAPIEENMIVRLPDALAALPKAACAASLGNIGHLSFSAVNVADGRLTGDSASGPIELPLAAVKALSFSLVDAALGSKPTAQAGPHLLVFRNGSRLPGALLKSEGSQPLVWQTDSKQVLEIGAAQIAGVILSEASNPVVNEGGSGGLPLHPSLLELRNGDCLRGELAGMNGQTVSFNNELIGPRLISRETVWRLCMWAPVIPQGVNFPTANLYRFNGKSAHPTVGLSPNRWIYLDGCYYTAESDANVDSALALSPEWLPERFDFSFDVTSTQSNVPNLVVKVCGADGESYVLLTSYFQNVNVNVVLPNPRRNIVKQVSIGVVDKTTRSRVRVLGDRVRGIVQIAIDGAKVFESSSDNQIPGLGKDIVFGSAGMPSVVSNIRLVPWSGELPASISAPASTILTNGDAIRGSIKAVSNGRLLTESDLGPVQIPLQQVSLIQCRGDLTPTPCAARIRLSDGTVLHLDSFRWDGEALSGKSAVLGDIRLQAAVVAELVLSPALARAPLPTQSKHAYHFKDSKAALGGPDTSSP